MNPPNAITISASKFLACFLAFALAASLAAASTPSEKQLQKIKHKVADALENHRRVTLETYDHRLLEGVISEAGPDTFVLLSGGTPSTLAYSDILSVKWPSGVSRQVKAIVAAVVIAGALLGCVILIGGTRG